MDPRIPRVRRKLAAVPFEPLRSHSFGEEHHRFRLGPRSSEARIAAFESEHRVALPEPYRQCHWGPNVSSARDFLAWYERWLDHMARGWDNRALELTSPRLHCHPNSHRLAPRI
ncbi:hypothetical protein [Streptomyces sp. NPDC052693]|uniref:hypothetical protein n=1 Tax=Streptomyces sp. NPDC052693 TaxID=3155814 RepID=UPI003416EA62